MSAPELEYSKGNTGGVIINFDFRRTNTPIFLSMREYHKVSSDQNELQQEIKRLRDKLHKEILMLRSNSKINIIPSRINIQVEYSYEETFDDWE